MPGGVGGVASRGVPLSRSLAHSFRTGPGRYDPFRKSSANDRYLRAAVIRCVVLARVKSPSQEFKLGHYPEKQKAWTSPGFVLCLFSRASVRNGGLGVRL